MIRNSRLFRIAAVLLLTGICLPVIASFHPGPDTLGAELKNEYKPASQTQYDLLLIFQKAKIERKRNPELSIKYYQEFHDRSVMAGEPYYAATALFEICRVYMDRHLYFAAIDYSLRAYQILTDNHLESKSNYFMIGMGNCYFQTGNYLIAEGYFRKAEALFRSNGDYFGIAVALNNIGLVKQKLNQKDSALWYFQNALAERRKTKVLAVMGHSYYYIGTAYANLNKLQEARKYLEMAIPLLYSSVDNLFLRHDFSVTMADAYYELGKLSDLENKPGEAISYYNTSLRICDTIFEQVKMPEIYIAMGNSYMSRKDYTNAQLSFRRALHIADSAKLFNIKKACYENMIQVFMRAKNIDSASANLVRYRQVTDTIQAQMIDSRFNEISLAIRIREAETEAKSYKEKHTYEMMFFLIIGGLMMLLILISVIYISKQRKNSRRAKEEIQARKKAEQDLEKLNLELKEINEGKDRLISIMSHDLRSPFNALMGFADLLVEETADKNIPEILHYSRMVQQISRSTFQLLENLLTWSRLQMGHIPFQPVNLQLYEEVSVAVDSIIVVAARKSIRIRNLVGADAVVFADSNMLQSILRNLISNAIKFSKAEGSIEIRSRTDNGSHVISVSDSGIGIPGNIREKLFSDSEGIISTNGTENEKGHGLGLLLCRYMVEKHGGRIWIESSTSKGSTFAFTLP